MVGCPHLTHWLIKLLAGDQFGQPSQETPGESLGPDALSVAHTSKVNIWL